jgi:hypothetical protein
VDVDSGRIIVVSAIDNLGKGAAGQAVQCANLMLGLPRRPGLARTEWRHERHRAEGVPGAGVAAGLKASGGSTWRWSVNDGPRFDAAGVFTANRVKAAPVLWSQQVLRHGMCARSCSTPAAPTPAPAGRVPGHPRHRRARGRARLGIGGGATSRSARPG